MVCVVGVDVAKQTFDAALPLSPDKFRTKGKLSNEAGGFKVFQAWLETHATPDAWVVMEATGVYHEALAEALHGLGYQVCVLNPAQVASYAESQLQRAKTDRVDAKLIARYAERHASTLRAWHPDPPAIKRLRAQVRRLHDLQEIEQMECNRLDVAEASVRPSIQSVITHVQAQIAQTRKAIRNDIDNDPTLRSQRDLLISIDGIGDTTAALLLAELGDMKRFRDVAAVTAFAGLNPQLRESGKHAAPARISRKGSAFLRAGLYMPAMTAMRYNPAVRALKLRLQARHKAAKQIICAAMRKLLHIAYGVIKSGRPFDRMFALAR